VKAPEELPENRTSRSVDHAIDSENSPTGSTTDHKINYSARRRIRAQGLGRSAKMRTARPRRDGGAGVVRPALDARLEGESGVRPNLSIPFRSPGLAERVPFGNGSHFWVMLPEAAGIMGRMELAATWWAIVQGLGVTSGERDPAGMVRALVGDDIPVEVLANDKWNCRMLLADHFQFDKAPNLVIAGDAAHLNPPWVATATTPALATRSMWPGNWPHASTAGPVRTCWPVTNQNAGRSRPAPSPTPRRTTTLLRTTLPTTFSARTGPEGDQARSRTAEALQVKDSEFHSLGLVLGYNYASSPLVTDDGTPRPT